MEDVEFMALYEYFDLRRRTYEYLKVSSIRSDQVHHVMLMVYLVMIPYNISELNIIK